ncbi:lipopolysaccharide heptosyltransferase RfaC [Candidatus Pantoea carbekii]|uniref:Lipopolysaccharide heptosyltransferase 1 n=1 Tax=Candidatus Pantoea carbekii TaxID=1235990 RepID=U3U8U3_9GAMM|nr:lipopolysaccharide heptosyltransferase RfaC [Candidatus Pantoea carbekii]AKC32344.1 lipopolysaccharide heptosyltransferase-1 [Candidatus Pantoea carbekii]BAO00063.1 lipopolysaccharide heptosyltransferase-1 [Candidatus Pantoea carbekii]
MYVLIVKTSSMGDILHTLPALTDAIRAIPEICFDWVVEENFAQIPTWHPSVNKVKRVAIRRWREHWFGTQQRKERMYFKRDLQSYQYDKIIDAQGLIKSAILVTRLAKGEKHGQDIKSAREPFASWWYDQCHSINKKQHAVERTRELFAKSLGYSKPITKGEYAISRNSFFQLPHDAYEYLLFLHSTTHDNKHWPEFYWRQLIQKIKPTNLKIKLLWKTELEYQRVRRLSEGFKHVTILPQLTLEKIAEQIVGARAIVSVDTGLSHLAAALDRPNITLYGPTDPQLIGGYGRNQIALISSTYNLNDLKVNHVLSHIQSILINS